jgi:hypothetical protein
MDHKTAERIRHSAMTSASFAEFWDAANAVLKADGRNELGYSEAADWWVAYHKTSGNLKTKIRRIIKERRAFNALCRVVLAGACLAIGDKICSAHSLTRSST